MPRRDYIRTPLKKREVLYFHLKLQATIIATLVNKVYETNTERKRRRAMLALFNALTKYYLPTVYNEEFCLVIRTKCKEYGNIDAPVFKDPTIPKGFKKSLSKVVSTLGDIIDANPFQYKITVSDTTDPTWTAVKTHYYLEHSVKKKNGVTRYLN
jgi:hypothetical protein